ncbi:MAG: ribonucleoside-diphosphate reductase, adenosylcobalamin-dependent [Candidatus Cloacimonas sp. 4484_209]|nr:MAG: ribonucleoside-diphosphate reductase, adenosylcobalamin-dependent [Candidatus Cloacimonas sp. 4484_209]
MIKEIRKRDGRLVDFVPDKITDAIYKAAKAVGGKDRKLAEELCSIVVKILNQRFNESHPPAVEEVQDIVEKVLMESGHAKTAKAYILYRQKRTELREFKKVLLGVEDDIKLSLNATTVLKRRYLRKNESGEVVETPSQLFHRVALNIASADALYNPAADVRKTEEIFYKMMTSLEFLPNSPTLMNAGTELQQLSACFVLPVGDSMQEIFDAVKYAAIIHKTGGGTGFSFSHIRPQNDVVKTTGGIASGPISFMKVFDAATEVIKQGGKRRGANMGILRIDHPDIFDFITCKKKEGILTNFNISVGVTDKFMEAVIKGEDFPLVNPRDGKIVQKINAKQLFDLITLMAWETGDPGVVFIDRLNKDNPTPTLGDIESTNPCGEQPLLAFEACNLGSINLAKMVKEGEIDYAKLEMVVKNAVHFLDNVIDMSKFPLKEIEIMVRGNRKIGLGVMGFADMLLQLNIPYNSDEAINIAEHIMRFISDKAREKSQQIAKERGPFPNFEISVFAKRGDPPQRNATLTTIAPTGTISIIANTSSGIEPIFAIAYIRNVMDNTELMEVNPYFEREAKRMGFYSETLMREIAKKGSIQDIEGIPEEIKRIFVTAHDIAPGWHVKMQAAFQKYVDNAVSKTVNLPHMATPEQVKEIYSLAYELGCKGVTIYRDGSKKAQVLNIGTVNKSETSSSSKIVDNLKLQLDGEFFTVDSEYAGGCPTCSL